MEVSPISSIRAAQLLNPGKEEDSLPPPFAIGSCELTNDDTYNSDNGRSDRELDGERDDADLKSKEQIGGGGYLAVVPDVGINLLA